MTLIRFGDAQKNLRKSERKIKELTFAADEDKKNHERWKFPAEINDAIIFLPPGCRPSSTRCRAR